MASARTRQDTQIHKLHFIGSRTPEGASYLTPGSFRMQWSVGFNANGATG